MITKGNGFDLLSNSFNKLIFVSRKCTRTVDIGVYCAFQKHANSEVQKLGYLNSSKRPFPYCSKALNFKVQNLSYEKEFYLQEKRIENHNIFISKASPLLSF